MDNVRISGDPEDYLRRALLARTDASRERFARAGLAAESITTDTQAHLLRQLYGALLAQNELEDALLVAQQMCQLDDDLRDLAYQDRSRVEMALGKRDDAIRSQRLALRQAPASRRSFQGFCLATLLHFGGQSRAAVTVLDTAERWARKDRPLIRAYRAWIRLEIGVATAELQRIINSLARSQAAEGYGQFVLGMLSAETGDPRKAAVYLRAFLRRNAAIDAAKRITLAEELSRARKTLARIESC